MGLHYVKSNKDMIGISFIESMPINIKYRYGIITNQRILDGIIVNNAMAIYDDVIGIYFNLISIINVYVYIISDKLQHYHEYNPTTEIISSKKQFWISKEVEYKIETREYVPLDRMITNNHSECFIFSHPIRQTSFERYHRITDGMNTEYIDILGKKSWKKPMALKYKKLLSNSPILSRTVYLLPYTKVSYDRFVESLFENHLSITINKLDAFYKSKERAICIDINKGIIYGVSSSKAVPLSRKRRELYQVEIEYWSMIISETDMNNKNYYDITDNIDFESFFELIEMVKQNLNVEFISPGCTKIEWLEE